MANVEQVQQVETPHKFVPEQPSVGLLDYILTILFGVSFLILLFFWDLVQRIAYYSFGERSLHRVDRTLNWLILCLLKITGASFTIANRFQFPSTSSYILVSNHQSMFDISMLHEIVWQHTPRFIAKRELGNWIPGISFNLRSGGHPLINRKSMTEALSGIAEFGRRLESEKFSAIIFPEGTRARDGILKKFKAGGLISLLKEAPSAKVIVVAIDGSWRFQTYNCWPIPRGSKVRAEVIDVLERNPDLKPAEISSTCEKLIAEKLDAWRSGL